MSGFVEWGALGNIVVWGVLVGAGLPTIFALGVAVSQREDLKGKGKQIPRWRTAVAVICYGVIVAAILVAIAFIVSGGHG